MKIHGLKWLLALVVLSLVLTACGNKGALVKPEPKSQPETSGTSG